jgi:hypothetical protein
MASYSWEPRIEELAVLLLKTIAATEPIGPNLPAGEIARMLAVEVLNNKPCCLARQILDNPDSQFLFSRALDLADLVLPDKMNRGDADK